ncbi:MAG: zinc ribbon domain-containing protein [Planctomycetes bacterium]|nr:zinc ribbon domain-containing protein [Planctomycetota bacterium]
MFDFCPHCGQTIEQEQVAGRMLVCSRCGEDIGFAATVQRSAVAETDQRILAGTAALCPACEQIVDVKISGALRTSVPHYGAGAARKICPASGKPVADQPTAAAPAGKNLRALMTRDVVKLIYAPRNNEPRIEVLTLEYLDKSERVRIQIEALREMMGFDFHVGEYPAALNKPHLAVWSSSDSCVVAMKHERGGFQSIADAEVAGALADLREHRASFFG